MRLSRLLFFEPMQRGNEWFRANRLESPIARWLRKLSFDHWVLGSILTVTVMWAGFFLLFELLTWGRILTGLAVIVVVGYVLTMPWFILFNRWRVQNGRQ